MFRCDARCHQTRSGAPLGAGMQEEQLVQAVIQERFEDAISRVRACKQNGIAVNTQDVSKGGHSRRCVVPWCDVALYLLTRRGIAQQNNSQVPTWLAVDRVSCSVQYYYRVATFQCIGFSFVFGLDFV